MDALNGLKSRLKACFIVEFDYSRSSKSRKLFANIKSDRKGTA